MPQSIHAFAEKVALIVNGDEGIGRAVALQLAMQGAYVIVGISNRSKEGEIISEQLKSLGTLAHTVRFENAAHLADEIEKIYGRIDLIVICVKTGEDSEFLINETVEKSQRLTDLRPKVSIVNCGTDERIIEATKKAAEKLPAKFRVNCVVSKPQKPKKEFELFTENNFDDVARVILFFLSSEAKSLNGQVLFTD